MSAAVRALMAGAIDYAGLFPPAGLPMAAAVQNYSGYRAGPNAWMLGRFIVPVARLEEFVEAFTALPVHAVNAGHAGHDERSPWPLSVIAKASDAATVAAFNGRYGSRARIDTIEAPPGQTAREADIEALAPLAATYSVFAEVGWADDPTPLIASLAQHGLMAKIRTGGVAAEAFPPPEAVARFVLACRVAKVPFKATAGLHHMIRGEYPLTYEPGCARATMYGFMNVMLASAAAGADAQAIEFAGILDEHDVNAITFEEGNVRVGSHVIDVAAIETARSDGMRAFGSCSFDEPVAELTGRGLL